MYVWFLYPLLTVANNIPNFDAVVKCYFPGGNFWNCYWFFSFMFIYIYVYIYIYQRMDNPNYFRLWCGAHFVGSHFLKKLLWEMGHGPKPFGPVIGPLLTPLKSNIILCTKCGGWLPWMSQMTLSHNKNQCWLVVLWHSPEDSFTGNVADINH